MFEIVYDDGLTDGRRLDGYTISSPCEPNGSGELITQGIQPKVPRPPWPWVVFKVPSTGKTPFNPICQVPMMQLAQMVCL